MKRLRGWWSRIRGTGSERELRDELESHLQMHLDDNLRAGMTEAEARRAALTRLGGVAQVIEQTRDVRAGAWLERALQDATQGIRLFLRTPRFTLLATAILALGIGAATSVFALINSVLLKPLPVSRPHELVWLRNPSFSFPAFRSIRERQQVFSGVFGWTLETAPVRWNGDTELTSTVMVTGEYFSTLGVHPILGRPIGPQDEGTGGVGSPVAVISHRAWQRRFSGDPGVLGRPLVVGQQAFTIVGVTPPGFFGVAVGFTPEVILPATTIPLVSGSSTRVLTSPTSSVLHVMARRRAGVSFDQAQAAFGTLWPQVLEATARPNDSPASRARHLSRRTSLAPGETGFSRLRTRFSEPLWFLLSLVGLLLFVSCGTVAHLLLARGAVRQREFALRLAIGAGPKRLAGQLFVEGLLLSTLASVAGALASVWTSGLLVRTLSTAEDPISIDVVLDWRVHTFVAGLAVLTSLLFTVLPAIRATRLDPGAVLKAHARPLQGGTRGWRTAKLVVVSQVACSLLLVAGAALFLRSLNALLSIDAGFDRSGLLVVQVEPSPAAGRHHVDYYAELQRRLAEVPGVLSVSHSWRAPVGDGAWTQPVGADSNAPDESGPEMYFNVVSPRYFANMGIPVVAGRDFSSTDDQNAPRVAVVNESFARAVFGGQNPVGRRFTLGRDADRKVLDVIAIVRDAKYGYLHEPHRPVAYFPTEQWRDFLSDEAMASLVRVGVSPGRIVGLLRQVVRAVEPQSPIRIETVAERVNDSIARERLLALVATYLGVFALLLGCGALYGLISHVVERRTNEIGVRLALGAQRGAVLRMVLGDALGLAAIGIAIGLALVVSLAGLARNLLFGITPTDPFALAGAAALLMLVAVLAGYVPARRASQADPVAALRAD